MWLAYSGTDRRPPGPDVGPRHRALASPVAEIAATVLISAAMNPPAQSGRTTHDRPIVVWVLVPAVETTDATLDYYYDFSAGRAEFERAFAALETDWRWEPVTTTTFRTVIDRIVAESATQTPLVFNLCDGDEINAVPGISVIRYLNAVGLRHTGSDEHFYQITTSKIDMKRAFERAGVPTPPWEALAQGATLDGLFERHGRPLIVKPAVSAGSMGITIQSVVHTDDALAEQLQLLHDGYHGWNLADGGVFVERYIVGPEFTTFIVGSSDSADSSTIYPPVERVFHAALPPNEQFLSFDRLWEVHEKESPMADGASLWEYQPAAAELQQQISDISWAAYASVGGQGYGRVDLRMDAATGDLYVLEVNAQCGLSEDENYTSIGAILRFAERPFHGLLREIMDCAAPAPRSRVVADTSARMPA